MKKFLLITAAVALAAAYSTVFAQPITKDWPTTATITPNPYETDAAGEIWRIKGDRVTLTSSFTLDGDVEAILEDEDGEYNSVIQINHNATLSTTGARAKPRIFTADQFVSNPGANDWVLNFSGANSIALAGDFDTSCGNNTIITNNISGIWYNTDTGKTEDNTLTLGTPDSTITMAARYPIYFQGTGETVLAGWVDIANALNPNAADTTLRFAKGGNARRLSLSAANTTIIDENAVLTLDDAYDEGTAAAIPVNLTSGSTLDIKGTMIAKRSNDTTFNNLHSVATSASTLRISEGGTLIIEKGTDVTATTMSTAAVGGSLFHVKGLFDDRSGRNVTIHSGTAGANNNRLLIEGPNAMLKTLGTVTVSGQSGGTNNTLEIKDGGTLTTAGGLLFNALSTLKFSGDAYIGTWSSGTPGEGTFVNSALSAGIGTTFTVEEEDANLHADLSLTGAGETYHYLAGDKNLQISGNIYNVANQNRQFHNIGTGKLILGRPTGDYIYINPSINANRALVFSGTGDIKVQSNIQNGDPNNVPVDGDGQPITYGASNIHHRGSSTLELAGTNTYTGTTNLDGASAAAILLITGDSSGATGTVTINATGKLGGDGKIGGVTNVNGTLIIEGLRYAPANPANRLTIANNAKIEFDGNDPIRILSGGLTIPNGATIEIECLGKPGSWTYSATPVDPADCLTIFTYDPAIDANIIPSGSWTVNLSGTGIASSATTTFAKEYVESVPTGRVYLVDVTKPVISVSSKQFTVPATADSHLVDVKTNVANWTLTVDSKYTDWLNTVESGGTAATEDFTFTVGENKDVAERVGYIVIKDALDKADDIVIKVTQVGAAVKLEPPSPPTDDIVVGWKGTEATPITVDFEANIPWTATVTQGASWLTLVNPSGNTGAIPVHDTYTFRINVGAYTEDEQNDRIGEITVRGNGAYSDHFYTIPVKQEAFVPTLVMDKSTLPTPSLAWNDTTSYTITVTSNVGWEVLNIPDWLTIAPTKVDRDREVSGTDSFTITAKVNAPISPNTGAQRPATLTVKAGYKTETITVTQRAWEETMTVTPDKLLPVPATGDTSNNEIRITSNTTWMARSNNSWIHIVEVTGMDDLPKGTPNTPIAGMYQVVDPSDALTESKLVIKIDPNEVEGDKGAQRTGTIFIFGKGEIKTVTITQRPPDIAQRPKYSVYETKVSARTSTLRQMNVKLNGAAPNTRSLTFRVPVTKNYTLLMAYDDDTDIVNRLATKGVGRMWVKNGQFFEVYGLEGEYLQLSGKDLKEDVSFIGVRGLNVSESGEYRMVDSAGVKTGEILCFDGLATKDAKGWRLASSVGMLYGEKFMPFGTGEQGDGFTAGDDQRLIATVYYPQPAWEEAIAGSDPAPAHFFGTYTTRYNKARSLQLENDTQLGKEPFAATVNRLMKAPRDGGRWNIPEL